jgi:hypothetical protein
LLAKFEIMSANDIVFVSNTKPGKLPTKRKTARAMDDHLHNGHYTIFDVKAKYIILGPCLPVVMNSLDSPDSYHQECFGVQ